MSAFVKNLTTLPDEEISLIVYWVLDAIQGNVSSTAVVVAGKTVGLHHGRFYGRPEFSRPRVWKQYGPFPPEVQHLLKCVIPYTPTMAAPKRFATGPPSYFPHTWEESLVCITAHEAYHLTEWMNPDREIRWNELRAEWAEYEHWVKWNERRKP